MWKSNKVSLSDIIKTIEPRGFENVYKYPSPYPKMGFESTWRYKDNLRQKAADESEDGYLSSSDLTRNNAFMDKFKKLTQWGEIDVDPHNIEIPTKIVTNKNNLLVEFKKLSKIMGEQGYIESSRSYNNNLEGGGHIHLDFSEIFGTLGYGNDYYLQGTTYFGYFSDHALDLNYDKFNHNKPQVNAVFALFVQNLSNFIINNPWIPWAFNAPNDNICAMNNICNDGLDNDFKIIRSTGLQRTYNIGMDCKKWAITLRPDMGTFEFRFFGMPKNADELSLHIDLAQAIYKHCYDLTMKGNSSAIKRKYHSWEDLTEITYRKSLNGLKGICTKLGVDYEDLVKHGKIENLKVRYAYQQTIVDSGDELLKSEMVLN